MIMDWSADGIPKKIDQVANPSKGRSTRVHQLFYRKDANNRSEPYQIDWSDEGNCMAKLPWGGLKQRCDDDILAMDWSAVGAPKEFH